MLLLGGVLAHSGGTVGGGVGNEVVGGGGVAAPHLNRETGAIGCGTHSGTSGTL